MGGLRLFFVCPCPIGIEELKARYEHGLVGCVMCLSAVLTLTGDILLLIWCLKSSLALGGIVQYCYILTTVCAVTGVGVRPQPGAGKSKYIVDLITKEKDWFFISPTGSPDTPRSFMKILICVLLSLVDITLIGRGVGEAGAAVLALQCHTVMRMCFERISADGRYCIAVANSTAGCTAGKLGQVGEIAAELLPRGVAESMVRTIAAGWLVEGLLSKGSSLPPPVAHPMHPGIWVPYRSANATLWQNLTPIWDIRFCATLTTSSTIEEARLIQHFFGTGITRFASDRWYAHQLSGMLMKQGAWDEIEVQQDTSAIRHLALLRDTDVIVLTEAAIIGPWLTNLDADTARKLVRGRSRGFKAMRDSVELGRADDFIGPRKTGILGKYIGMHDLYDLPRIESAKNNCVRPGGTTIGPPTRVMRMTSHGKTTTMREGLYGGS